MRSLFLRELIQKGFQVATRGLLLFRRVSCCRRSHEMGARILILGILFLLFILRWRGIYAVPKQEGKLEYLMEELEMKYTTACRKKALADWNYWINMTGENKILKNRTETEYLTLQRLAWNRVREHDWRKLIDPVLRRKFRMLSMIGNNALPTEKYNELSFLLTAMDDVYNHAAVCDFSQRQKCNLTLEKDLSHIMASSHNYAELLHIWQSWRNETGRKMKKSYIQIIKLSNEAAKYNGFADTTQYWLAIYEVPGFAAEVEAVWQQVRPLYQHLHTYVRKRLHDRYGDSVPRSGLIPAHVLGDMWAKDWSNLKDLVLRHNTSIADVTETMQKQGYTPKMLYKKAEEYFVSLGWPQMSSGNMDFWNESVLTVPLSGEDECLPRAMDFCSGTDFRLKMCPEISEQGYLDVHKQLSEIQYYMHYSHQPFTFRKVHIGANSGLNLALEGLVELSVSTPSHLQKENLLKKAAVTHGSDTDLLMLKALKIIPSMSYAFVSDLWRWQLFSGNIQPENMNRKWLQLREKIQGLKCENPNLEDNFDPGAHFHIAANVPLIRNFVGEVVKFQLLKALCKEFPGIPLHRCDLNGSREAGAKLGKMLALGSSKPWTEALQLVTGTKELDATPLLEYFQPLLDFLQAENRKTDEVIGWGKREKAPSSTAAVLAGCVMAALVTAVMLIFLIGRRNSRKMTNKAYIGLSTTIKAASSAS